MIDCRARWASLAASVGTNDCGIFDGAVAKGTSISREYLERILEAAAIFSVYTSRWSRLAILNCDKLDFFDRGQTSRAERRESHGS